MRSGRNTVVVVEEMHESAAGPSPTIVSNDGGFATGRLRSGYVGDARVAHARHGFASRMLGTVVEHDDLDGDSFLR